MAKRILLVEDDLDIQRIYSEKLKGSGYEVILAADAAQGFQSAKEDNFNLILLDIMLPGKMNGFDLLEILKKDDKLKKVPVIVLTNLDTEKQQALKIGANDYLVKANMSLDDVLKKVEENVS